MTTSLKTYASYAITVFAAALLHSCAAADTPQTMGAPGDVFNVKLSQKSEGTGKGSFGNSKTGMSLTETIIAYRDDGVVLEFDLPAGTDERMRLKRWQFPARILKAEDGTLTLENVDALQARSGAWQKRAKLDPSYCGKWVFTWVAQKIECDPKSAIEIIKPFIVWQSPLANGALYADPDGLSPVKLSSTPAGPGMVYSASVKLNPQVMIREKNETDAIVTEIMGERAQGLNYRAGETYSATRMVQFTTDAAGRIFEKKRVTKTETFLDGKPEGQTTATQIVTREKTPVSPE